MQKNQASPTTATVDEDVKLLHSMGYAQELKRRMSGFSNFAISFSIICILAGGITAFPSALGAGGGLAIGLGWPLGTLFALVVALAMAQIASAYPTAGGLYHWGSILGGKGFGWATAWFNLLGLIFVVASVNFGLYDPFVKTQIMPLLGIDPAKLGWWHQTGFLAAVTLSQALLNHKAARLTTLLTDLSGTLIFILAVVLILSLLIFSPVPVDFSRLFTFTNFTGAEGSSWPKMGQTMAFLSALLLTIYTITGFDASAHTAEETHGAAHNVPRGIIRSVLWSGLFGYLMICAFVLVMPSVAASVKQGGGFFEAILAPIPPLLRIPLGIGIVLVNYLCALATLTSTSRMMYAFARDGGLPLSNWLRQVDPQQRTPGPAIWVAALLAISVTLYGDGFLVLAAGSAVLLYISYILPTAAGLFAEGNSWTHKGPFDLKGWSKPVAVLAVLGGSLLVLVGVEPPNEKVLYVLAAMGVTMLLFWWVFGIRQRFAGPPQGEAIAKRRSAIDDIEAHLTERQAD
jgi:amino acid transporter